MSVSFSEERLAPANGIELAYQEVGDPDGEPLLLIMGLATQMLAWDEGFCAMLAERGFRVVRFDNRDIGHSTMIDAAGMPLAARHARRPPLDRRLPAAGHGRRHLRADGPSRHRGAHVVGASMGGMIAQTMAIHRPERVRSLVSMMSTTGSRWVGQPTCRPWGLLLAKYPRPARSTSAGACRTLKVIGSPGYPMGEGRVARAGRRDVRPLPQPAGIVRQMHAISASGDRTRRCARSRCRPP